MNLWGEPGTRGTGCNLMAPKDLTNLLGNQQVAILPAPRAIDSCDVVATANEFTVTVARDCPVGASTWMLRYQKAASHCRVWFRTSCGSVSSPPRIRAHHRPQTFILEVNLDNLHTLKLGPIGVRLLCWRSPCSRMT